jgi:hypothetical protein
LRRFSIRYVDPLDAQAVDERHEFVRCEVKIESLDEYVLIGPPAALYGLDAPGLAAVVGDLLA